VNEATVSPTQDQTIHPSAGSTERAKPAAADRPILMVVGGGLENGGGIGRMVGYTITAWNAGKRPPMQVIDTRGPKLRRSTWPLFLLSSIVQVIRHVPRRPLLHIHLAANTSTLRKLCIAYLGRLFGLDYVIHLHDPAYATFYSSLPRWGRSLVRTMYHKAARVIVLGSPAGTVVSDLLEVPKARIDLVPNAVPGPENLVRHYDETSAAAPHLLFLGELQNRKGVHDLLEALARPEMAALRWTATLAGGGADQAR
jgi:glycosyltransferase involved in cell wall biosynthesis